MKTDSDDWVVIWTDPSVEDVIELADYISRDSPRYASIVVHQVYEAGESLSQFPLRGRVVPEFSRKDIREIFSSSYRIIYKVESNRVAVLAIIHFSRDLKKIMGKE